MKQLYLILLFLLAYSAAHSQKSFQPGFIIQNGDTLRGLVDYRGAVRSAKVTTFKKSEGAPEQTFTSSQVQAYGFDEGKKLFESFEVMIVADTTKEQVFLQALAKGKASVYYYRDDFQRDRYFLLKENGPLIELKYIQETRQDPATGKKYKAYIRAYAQVLKVNFADCEQISGRLSKLPFSANALADITESYNQCMGEGTNVKADIKKSVFTFAPAITYTSSSFILTGEEHPISSRDYKDEAAGVGGGFSVNITMPRLNEKLSIQADVLYMPFKQTASFNAKNNFGFTYKYDVLFDVDYLKVPIQLVYTYPNGKLKPYLSAGLANSFAIQLTQEATRTDTFNPNDPRVRKEPAFGEDGFRKRTLGLTAGAGVQVPVGAKAVTLSVRYELNESSSKINSLSANAKHIYVMLGYRL